MRSIRPDHLKKNKGITLFELLVTISVISITLSLAIPAFKDLIDNHKSQYVTRLFYRLVQFSRHLAISENTSVTLCKSQSFTGCDGDWKDGIIVFTDANKDRKISDSDRLYKTIATPFTEGSVKWRSFGNKSYLQFLPSGSTNYQNGTFTYCIDESDIKKARGLSITVTGRPQIAFDRNGDGVRENSSGTPLRC